MPPREPSIRTPALPEVRTVFPDNQASLASRESLFLPGRPIAFATWVSPSLAVFLWFVGREVWAHRGDPGGDTTFAWMSLVAVFIWFAAMSSSGALYGVLRGTSSMWPHVRRRTAFMTASLVTILALVVALLLFGESFDSSHNDGFPTDSLTVMVFRSGAAIAMAPSAWMWWRLLRE